MRLRHLLFFLAATMVTVSSSAQTPYIVGAVGLDASRFRHVEDMPTRAEGEGAVFSVRLGTPLGARWGVELAFSRPTVVAEPALFPTWFDDHLGESSARRNSTLDTVVWVTQKAGKRVNFVYLGGVAFARIVEDYRVFDTFPTGSPFDFDVSLQTTSYGAGPLVGAEGRIALTDHLFLVPGARFFSVGEGGWILRATTGLGWQF